jgi:hypothetical protein
LIAEQEETDAILYRARDFLVHRDSIGRIQFHHENSSWTKIAVLQGQHPELRETDPYVKRWLQKPKNMLCPEPGCLMSACDHNLVVFQFFVEILNSVDLTLEFKSTKGLSRYTGTQSEFEASLCTGRQYESSQLTALLLAGFDYPTIVSIIKTFSGPATYSDNIRLSPVGRKSEIIKWEFRHHFFKFVPAGWVTGPRDIFTPHYPAPPFAAAVNWKTPNGANINDWLEPLRYHFDITFDDFDYRPLVRNEVRQLFDIKVS